ncbi:hypothetical protein M5689_022261 [Euphorbia peplus]|nr:hypothetical protein M5689_022261 [Euphorbia peplus]
MVAQKLICFTFLLLFCFRICNAEYCAPCSCGDIHNISYPFRLKSDTKGCGVDTYELSCENNTLVLYFYDQVTKLNVKAINYDNYTIRVADPGLDEHDCSSVPRFAISTFDREGYSLEITDKGSWTLPMTETISFINCLNLVNSSSYVEITSRCIDNGVVLISSNSTSSRMYSYAFRGLVNAYDDLRENCSLEMTSMLPVRDSDSNSMETFVKIHRQMAYGFEVSWHDLYCSRLHCEGRCYLDRSQANKMGCINYKINFGDSMTIATIAVKDLYRNIKYVFGKTYS